MTQTERRSYLIAALLQEQPRYSKMEIPSSEQEQKVLLRSLFNIRMPLPVTDEFLAVQDAYLQEETRRKGVTALSDLKPVQKCIYLWRGDITTLAVDAIVNAANSGMLGCFRPNHGCIDNAIHTFAFVSFSYSLRITAFCGQMLKQFSCFMAAGVQLRLACADLMNKQGHEEETGKAKITPAYNLPSRYVLHTVGPIIHGDLTQRDCQLLASCYQSCLALVERNGLKSIAFCCVSTGEFHFPNDKAAQIAVETVKRYKEQTHSEIEVIFNVFKETDYNIYRELLRAD